MISNPKNNIPLGTLKKKKKKKLTTTSVITIISMVVVVRISMISNSIRTVQGFISHDYGGKIRTSIIRSVSSSSSPSQFFRSQSQTIMSATAKEDTTTTGTGTVNHDDTNKTTTTDDDDDAAAAASLHESKSAKSSNESAKSSKSKLANEVLLNLITKSKIQLKQNDGLDPYQNKIHCPFVYHDGYSNVKDWPEKHTFPMMKFERLANALLTTTPEVTAVASGAAITSTNTNYQPQQQPLVRSRNDFFSPPDFVDLPINDWLDILYDTNTNNTNSNTDESTTTTIINNNNNKKKNDDSNSLLFGYRFLNGDLTKEEERQIGFREQTSKQGLIERTFLEIGGTIVTSQLAIQYGLAANLAGGTHHAHPTGGAGYTILNDLAITSKILSLATCSSSNSSSISTSTSTNNIDYTNIKRILVIDCDVHQGDGTAQYSTLWKKDNDEQFLFTLSMHAESNYPFIKHNSTYDIGLKDGCNDENYLQKLKICVDSAIQDIQPDLILYDAGVDVYINDTLGRLNITSEGIRLRDRYVINKCVSCNIPIACVIGGGYDKDINALGRRHAILHEECAYVWQKYKLWNRKR